MNAPSALFRHVQGWAAALMLMPLPIWFVLAVLRDRGPVWRAEYHDNRELTGVGVVVAERELNRYWDRDNTKVAGSIDPRHFSARYDTCMSLTTNREIPFMLVAMGAARFTIDGAEKLVIEAEKERRTRGDTFWLEAGMHHLSVTFSARGWPSIALHASFDGRAPVPFPSAAAIPGVVLVHPRPGDAPCAAAR